MIPVVRSAPPPIPAKKATQWHNAYVAATTRKEKDRAETKYRHKQIRDALQRMFHGKCAYCESNIGHVSDAHIEHYRPKAKFPHLTFDWDNLLLACSKCNGAGYKGDNFPEANDGGPLVNPCTSRTREI